MIKVSSSSLHQENIDYACLEHVAKGSFSISFIVFIAYWLLFYWHKIDMFGDEMFSCYMSFKSDSSSSC
jgi:hypothetical protein